MNPSRRTIPPRPSPLIVGKSRIYFLDNGKVRFRTAHYKDVEFDPNYWALPKLYMPEEFDLLRLKLVNRSGTFSGWRSGTHFLGSRIFDSDQVRCWQRVMNP